MKFFVPWIIAVTRYLDVTLRQRHKLHAAGSPPPATVVARFLEPNETSSLGIFIQFNAQPVAGGGDPGRMEFAPLPQRHVDTGMGFERVTAIIQGTKNLTDFSGTISNYETDIFRPIFDALEELSGKKYGATIPIVGQAHRLPDTDGGSRSGRPTNDPEQEKIDIAFRVIADHIRALSFAIADGIIPSNEGRGYVLRRILRRAVRYGRTLGFHEPFFFKLVDVVAKTMGDVFPEVRTQSKKRSKKQFDARKKSFNKTLDRGIAQFYAATCKAFTDALTSSGADKRFHFFFENAFGKGSGIGNVQDVYAKLPEVRIDLQKPDLAVAQEKIGKIPVISGASPLNFYDTYGFPLDLTELMARERRVSLSMLAGFEQLMD